MRMVNLDYMPRPPRFGPVPDGEGSILLGQRAFGTVAHRKANQRNSLRRNEHQRRGVLWTRQPITDTCRALSASRRWGGRSDAPRAIRCPGKRLRWTCRKRGV